MRSLFRWHEIKDHHYFSSLYVLKELKAEALVFMGALYDTWQIREENFRIVHKISVANVRTESCEGVAGDFRKSTRDLQLNRKYQ